VAGHGRAARSVQPVRAVRLRGLQGGTEAGGAALHFVKWGPDMTWPASGAVLIQDGVDAVTAIEPDRKVVVFTSRQPGREGLCAVRLPL
jgi:hypothetical protein